jgi:hypothetical protein
MIAKVEDCDEIFGMMVCAVGLIGGACLADVRKRSECYVKEKGNGSGT